MKIGIISDTHDHQEHVLAAINILNEFDLDYVLHAGDFVSPFTVRSFAQLKSAKLIAVFGNNDGKRQKIREIIADFGGEIFNTDYRGILNDKKIYTCTLGDISESIGILGNTGYNGADSGILDFGDTLFDQAVFDWCTVD